MLCDNCGKREANIRYEENINGVKKKMNLCAHCSDTMGVLHTGKIENMFLPFFEPFGISYMPEEREDKCPRCGYTFPDYINTGLFGCPECYDTFGDRIDSMLYKLNGKHKHVIPEKVELKEINSIPKKEKAVSKLEEYKEKLDLAIKEERYEDAAKLRDKINDLKNKEE